MITIVSGLPRSGTSLMMQMLAAGGMPTLTDGARTPDIDNPRGYYEWERIKLLPQDPNCISEAEGRAVKVISQLLFALPRSHDYQIIFLERALLEVVNSQAEMIRRRGTSGAILSQAALIAGLQAHLSQVNAWLESNPSVRLCRLAYRHILDDAKGTSEILRGFLQRPLDVERMAEQVDQSLYRHRAE